MSGFLLGDGEKGIEQDHAQRQQLGQDGLLGGAGVGHFEQHLACPITEGLLAGKSLEQGSTLRR